MKEEKSKSKKQGNIYDRIFKENARELFLPLVEKQLGIKIITYEALPEKLQKTTEREADFLYKVITEKKETFLLHIEFQNKNDPKMLSRMAEYHGLFYRKYNLPIRHVVIYLGKRKATMKNTLGESEIFRGFETISIYDFDPNEFLSSQVPSVIMLALLTNFKEERKEAILRLILKNIKKQVTHESDIKKYIEQLLILARIRNLEKITGKIIDDMPISYDIEKDGFYIQGIQKGIKKGREEGREEGEQIGLERTLLAIRCLQEGKTSAETAKITTLTLEQVKKIKKQIS